MNSTYYCPEHQRPSHPYQTADQSENMEMTNLQKQSQTLYIRKSHNVQIAQQQAQGLIALEVSLQAAIEAALAIFDAQDDMDTTDLQRLVQELKVLQLQKEIIAIECSDDVQITQQQIQIEVVIQAVIQLLAKVSAKVVDA